MRKEEKAQIIDQVAAQLAETPNFYVTDISGLRTQRGKYHSPPQGLLREGREADGR